MKPQYPGMKITEKALELSQQTTYELDAIQTFLDKGAMVGKTEDELGKQILNCFWGDAGMSAGAVSCRTACFDFALRELGRQRAETNSSKLAALAQPAIVPSRQRQPLNRAQRRAQKNKR